MANEPKFIVVVGASAGGLNAVIELSAQLTPEMDVAVFVVLHLSHLSASELLVARLQKNSAFTCKSAEHEEPIQSRHLYFAVPDKHLLLKDGKMLLGDGSPENRWRPSIDVLFRSAAAAYDGRTIGIVLSGLMQDGTAGMQAIQRCGGTTIVQDPGEAEYPDMPLSVMEAIKVDYSVPLSRMGEILLEKSQYIGIPKQSEIPADIRKEAQIVERVTISIEAMKELGDKSLYSCPECGGGLWEIKEGNVVRYRCHTGHMYTQDELSIRQSEALEGTLWVALRMLEERKNLLEKMATEEMGKGWQRSATLRRTRASELQSHIERLKDILFHTKDADLPATG
jgi:two-component system, chemotaxis family, protein-glutamate methylesterase/glutaminase